VSDRMAELEGDPLGKLKVIQRLDVGPVQLEQRRLRAPYRLTQNGLTVSTELSYRFEEEVFSPHDPASLNLAGMLSAQVALNYGLFCDEIVFHGIFDRHDQRFIREMARNTAREIFVKKFLEPNPFLRFPFTGLPPVKRETYLQARLLFEDAVPVATYEDQKERSWQREWDADPSKHALLSSGGKDSLLSFGLMNEIGCEVHPIFTNESGRHWFTALNAYRSFARSIPGTGRVWTNADRLFNWIARHLPFIRQDFLRIRADEYPVRLWTVAVFLFGALPILKKRGIGRLLIGDEFDTTVRLSHQGIIHYNGLYDQSRYFDNVLTRYFHSKGWGISQFSVLRPFGELLIEKILVERYSELQRHQTSCHATHKEGERVRPCGRCEKCRRIMGMLLALGADPALCGYTPEQVGLCLKDLEKKGVHQETEGAEHLAYLLRQKGLIETSALGSVTARERPEILKMRFDSEKSPIEGIPVDLREPLYRLCLKHATGAVKRSGRRWIDFDPLTDSALKRPYPFEKPLDFSTTSRRSAQKGFHAGTPHD
jgi:hypothetical protein